MRTTRGRRAAATPPRTRPQRPRPRQRTSTDRDSSHRTRRDGLAGRWRWVKRHPIVVRARPLVAASPATGTSAAAMLSQRELVDPLGLKLQRHWASRGASTVQAANVSRGTGEAAQLAAVGGPALVPRHATDQEAPSGASTCSRSRVEERSTSSTVPGSPVSLRARRRAFFPERHQADREHRPSEARQGLDAMPGGRQSDRLAPVELEQAAREHFVELRWSRTPTARPSTANSGAQLSRASNLRTATSRGR